MVAVGCLGALLLLVGLSVWGPKNPGRRTQPAESADAGAPAGADTQHPDARSLTVAEKKYFGAAGGYLKTVYTEDTRLARTMAGAQTAESTLGDIKDAIQHAKAAEDVAYFGDYKPAAVPARFEPVDNKIGRCKSLHDAAFKELLAYWTDQNTAHIESGNATLKRAILITNECVTDLNGKIESLIAERHTVPKQQGAVPSK